MVLSGRFSKTIQFAIGLAAASGFALVLNNGAWAAEVVSPDTVAQAPSLNQLQTAQDQLAQKVAAANQLSSHLSASLTAQDGGESQIMNHGAVTGQSSDTPSGPVAVSTVGGDQAAGLANPRMMTTPTESADTPLAQTNPVSTDQASPSMGVQLPVAPTSTPPAVNAPQLTVPVLVSEAGSTHRYRAIALVIQPTITSQNDLPAGLVMGSQMPRTAQDSKVPAHPNGLLSTLVAELGGIIMPQLAALPILAASPIVAVSLLLLAVTLCLFNLPSFSYGLWLRRSGYAHAARSDMAALFFATPLTLSYAKPVRLPHSSFSLWCQTTNDVHQLINQEGR